MPNNNQDVLDSYYPGNEIFAYLNRIKTGTNTPLRIILLINNTQKKFNFINNELRDENFNFSILKENNSFILWNVESPLDQNESIIKCPHCNKEIIIEEEQKYPLKRYLVESKNSNLLVYVTNDKFHIEKIERFFNYLYPIINRIFYSAQDLKFILDNISEKNYEIKGRQCVTKRLYSNKMTDITYREDTIDGFFERAKNQKTWVDSIEVNISKLGTIRFSRKGEIQYSFPFNFAGFFEIIIGTILNEILKKRRDLYKSRSRSIQSPNIKPLKIFFENNYFSDKKNIERLISRLNKSIKYETSVLYVSESLAHIEVFDYANGGSFDLYINSTNELVIVPQTQATEIAIEAIILRINDVFEGRVQ